MKKKGFTIIELLAVIVVLAIIAFITVSIVVDVKENSKRAAAERGAESYIDAVELAVGAKRLEDGTVLSGAYTIQEDGSLCKGEDNVGCAKPVNIDMNGKKPSSGNIYIKSGKVTTESTMQIGDFPIVYNDEKDAFVATVPKSFAEDDWTTIITSVQRGNLDAYKVGDTKEIALTGYTNGEDGSNGLYTIRIANMSTPEECNTEGYSQTACGFVIEFVDIITKRSMNNSSTNAGGWKASQMRKFVTPIYDETTGKLIEGSGTIYNALPKELKNAIIDTTVVSGHGTTSGETNTTTMDKIYLFSEREVGGRTLVDTAAELTRQLDYYSNLNVTTNSSNKFVVKNYNGNAENWWARSIYYYGNNTSTCCFNYFVPGGMGGSCGAGSSNGVAVAFRIG